MKFITPEQCRMARALMQWSREELAERSGLHHHTISAVEKGAATESRTLSKLIHAFLSTGVEFTPDGGVRPQSVSSYTLDSYLDLLDDVELSLPEGGEVLKHCVDDRRSTDAVIRKVKQMRQAGIYERLTISEDNDYITGDPATYRKIPAAYFASSEVVVIYTNKVAFFLDGKALVIVSETLSRVFKDQFEYWWKEGKSINGA